MHVEPSEKSFSSSRPNETEPSEVQANFANKNITTLPDELLVRILSNLDTTDLLNCQLVNRHWQELIDDDMLALAYYRRCHGAEQRISPLTVERYHSSIQGWLRGFSNLGRESAAQLDNFFQHKHFTEILFFSIAKVLAKAKALTCQDVGTIKHYSFVGEASFSPDGNYLVTVPRDYTAQIWELEGGQWQKKVTIWHSSPVKSARFSPDGKRLVIASYDNTAQIWELEGGQWRKKTTLHHSDPLMDAFFSPDGRYLLTISYAANIWELEGDQWQEKATIRRSSRVLSACFSPDGNHLVTTSLRGSTAEIWRLIVGQWGEEVEIECYEYGDEGATTASTERVNDVCFSPDGNYLVIAAAQTLKILELVDGKWTQSVALRYCSLVDNVRFSPDGNHLVTVSDWTAKIWRVVDDRWLEKAAIRHSGHLEIAIFSPDGSHLVTGSNDHTATIWGLADDDWQEKMIIPHSSSVKGASFSPDGKHLVLTSYDDTAKIWGVVDGQWQLKTTIEPSDLVGNTSFSPDGYHLVTTTGDIAKIWVLKSEENDDSGRTLADAVFSI